MKTLVKIVIFLAASLSLLTLAVTISMKTSALAQQQEPVFSAQLSGQQEVPPTNSQATGVAQFEVQSIPAQNITYRIGIDSINGVTAGQIHSGNVGKNGPVILTLFKYAS